MQSEQNLSEFRKDYDLEKKQISLERLRIACWIGIVIVPLFGLIDVFFVKYNLLQISALRFFFTYVAISVLLLTYTKFGRKYPVFLNSISFIMVGITFSGIVRLLGGYASTRYAGISLIMMTLGVLAPFGTKIASFVISIIYLSYLIPILIHDKITNYEIFLSNNFYIVATAAIALSGVYAANKLHLKEFLSRFELKKAHHKLKELDDLKSQFFTNISHEIKTPLSLIVTPTDILIKKYSDSPDSEQLKYLNMIKENSYKLHQLIEDLLEISKIEEGKIKLYLKRLDFIKPLQKIFNSFIPIAENKIIKYNFTNTIEEVQIFFDRKKVEKIITNLLSNAFKFTSRDGTIIVKTDIDEKNLFVTVSDTGIGISEKDQNIIFDRFRQVNGSLSRTYKGTGIGLSLAKELAQIHGGDITVKSSIGKGSSFTFSMPLIRTAEEKEKLLGHIATQETIPFEESEFEEESKEAQIKSLYEMEEFSARKVSKTEEKATILIIDDNIHLLNMLKSELSEGFNIMITASSIEGIEIARKYLPKLIITDIMMPGKDGYEVCKELKEDSLTSKIPVIFLTARKIDEKGKALADDFVTKPFNIEKLTSIINKHISK